MGDRNRNVILLGVLFPSEGKNEEFKPQDEFKLEPWIELTVFGIDMSFNKAVLYLVLSGILTCATMVYISKRMQARPNRVQTAVEALFTLMRDNIAGGNMDRALAKKWFPFVGTLFLFIWFSNLIGYIPLPTNDAHPVDIFRMEEVVEV